MANTKEYMKKSHKNQRANTTTKNTQITNTKSELNEDVKYGFGDGK